MHINLKATLLVIKDIDVNEHEILSNFTLEHKLKKGTTLLLLIYISQSQ
jgi:hypothetical protein